MKREFLALEGHFLKKKKLVFFRNKSSLERLEILFLNK